MIRWGIIGCGDVTEVKSGPAFNKVPGSKLVAVMRRNEEKVKDYAQRHAVAAWYTNADDLISDDNVNAVYIATPPSSHLPLALKCIAAGKPVYIEKPMALNAFEALQIAGAAEEKGIKVCIAHYRRKQPFFLKIKELIDTGVIGDSLFMQVKFFRRPLAAKDLELERMAWRVNPAISGGGLFHDIAPHQLDLALYLLGEPLKVNGLTLRQGSLYAAADTVSANILFEKGVMFSGTWSFNMPSNFSCDEAEIVGSKGRILFNTFNNTAISIETESGKETLTFDKLEHVQQPMIAAVVDYFEGRCANPCTAWEGVTVMKMMDEIVS